MRGRPAARTVAVVIADSVLIAFLPLAHGEANLPVALLVVVATLGTLALLLVGSVIAPAVAAVRKRRPQRPSRRSRE